jgi:nicotinate phosphoribosyltransferase
VRRQLDDLGATGTRIVVTSDLDEHAIAALAAAPVDGYGVGTQLVVGSGAPTAAMVYKLVARAGGDGVMVDVEKRSVGKAGAGGRKTAGRRVEAGVAVAEVVRVDTDPGGGDERPLQVPLVRAGEVVHRESLRQARDRHLRVIAELPERARKLSAGDPAIPTTRG